MFEYMDTLIPFFQEPNRRIHLRQLSKILMVSPATAKKRTDYLVKKNLILRNAERNLVLFQANVDDPVFKELKKTYSVLKIIDSGLIEFLNKEFAYPAMVLFGSVGKGEDSKNSDIDLFILSETKKSTNLEAFEKKLNRRIQLISMGENEFRNTKRQNPNLVNNILNGVKISGFIKVL